jgi:hypothetical protein
MVDMKYSSSNCQQQQLRIRKKIIKKSTQSTFYYPKSNRNYNNSKQLNRINFIQFKSFTSHKAVKRLRYLLNLNNKRKPR